MKAEQRPLGSQGLVTSAQGLGLMGMSTAYFDKKHAVTDEESIKVIQRAQELGITLMDSADVYGPHTNEVLLGKAIKGNRDSYTVVTKFGLLVTETGAVEVRGSPEYIRKCCEGSLKRLGIDCIDLYFQHRIDPTVDITQSVGEMKKLVQEGKVKYLGLSEVNAQDLRRAHAVHPISAVQMEWSLWSRDAEAEIVPTCRELGIGILAYSPLGRGFLTGTVTSLDDLGDMDFRKWAPRFQGEAFQQNLKAMQRVSQLAKAKGCTPAQLALAWVHAQGRDVFPIPGTTRLKRVDENAAAFGISLSKEEIRLLEEAVPASEVIGDRYPAMMQHMQHGQYGK